MGVSWAQAIESPYRFLAAACVAWKAILFAIAISSPGLGYDTSSSLLLSNEAIGNTSLPPILGHLIGKLTRWDAIYFVQAANRGYLYEQEWAFGWGFTQLIACITEGLTRIGVPNYDGLESLVGIWIASLSHLLSAFALFSLTCALFPSTSSKRLALTTSFLHIISPAGLFLSAPYAESSCALLSFVGCLLFTKSFSFNSKPSISHDLLLLASGITFGTAATFRSNSILNGLFFVEEASRSLLHLQYDFSLVRIRRLLMTGLGGMSVGIGFFLPQYIAYKEFCSASSELANRPWCQNTVPSIYTFVQEHYWNCGFLRYWKASNAPLFLLATPMFTVMVLSGIWGLNIHTTLSQDKEMTEAKQISIERTAHGKALVRNMAISQLMLILLTLTGAHVQIITRISSAYPVWMWYLGHMATSSQKMPSQRVKYFTRFMVVYAIVQAGLFASFLPPA